MSISLDICSGVGLQDHTVICSNMDRPRNYPIKWSKSEKKR